MPGGRPQSVTDEQIIRYLRESGEHVLTTAEVADEVDVSRRTALRRLTALADDGRIERKDIDDRRTVWWATASPSTPEAPAAPLRRLVGQLNAEAADTARARSQEWRESFDEEMAPDEA